MTIEKGLAKEDPTLLSESSYSLISLLISMDIRWLIGSGNKNPPHLNDNSTLKSDLISYHVIFHESKQGLRTLKSVTTWMENAKHALSPYPFPSEIYLALLSCP